jgi:hypothetical protein
MRAAQARHPYSFREDLLQQTHTTQGQTRFEPRNRLPDGGYYGVQ